MTRQCKFDGNLFCFFLSPQKKRIINGEEKRIRNRRTLRETTLENSGQAPQEQENVFN
jgi:hypothetical protein